MLRWRYVCKCTCMSYCLLIDNRDLLDCCGQSPGSESTGAAGESANIQYFCKVNESIVFIICIW